MDKKFNITVLILSFLIPVFLFGQDVTLTATVSNNIVGLDDQFQYSVEVAGKSTNLPAVEFPDFSNFYILSGPNTSTSIQWVNGSMTSSKSYSYYLQPKEEGQFIIGKAAIKTNGKEYYSNEIRITVKKGAAQNQQSNQPVQSKQDPEISGENLFLRTEISRNSAYLGQQILVEYKLYFKVNIRGYNFDKIPANAGFWSEDFDMPNQPVVENEIINGVNYNVATLKRIALFPSQVGELTLEPMEVTLEAVDKNATEINDAIELKIQLSGVGNIKLIDVPKPSIPQDIEQYEPKISSNINKQGNTISGTKTAEYILIPRIQGQYEIKPIQFSYFDPRTKKYNNITSNPIALNIARGSGSQMAMTSPGSGFSRQEVTLLGQDIRFIKEFSDFSIIGYRPYESIKFWSGILGGILLFIGFIAINNYQVRLQSNENLARSRRAGKIASKQLAEARKKIESENHNEFYKAISLALQGFVRDKMNIDLSDFSVTNVRKVLSERKVDQMEIDDYISVLEESDLRQFANIGSGLDEKKTIFTKSKDILTRLEKWI
jgi:hypothetical protein